MTSICLIRHGETDWNKEGRVQGQTDIPLNETGISQARQCGKLLQQSSWDMIITSPLQRAKQSATIINEKLQLPMIEMEAFKEKNYGDVEGMTVEERNKLYPNKNYPNQETQLELTERVMKGIHKINKTYNNKKILLVAHGGVINAILSHLSNGEIGSGKTKLSNACLSNIYLAEEKWHIKDYNQVTHLTNLD